MNELMKTNAIMIRWMGPFPVHQRTKDGMFNATGLLMEWNNMVELNVGNPIYKKKELKKFFENQGTQEFIDSLIEEENLDGQNSAYVKSRASRGENAGTWMHPILFMKFAMWLNPRFEVKVIKFVYDRMIEYRKESCDAYKKLSSAVATIVKPDEMREAMQDIAKGINYCIVNQHETDIRNKFGDEETQRKYFDFQRKVASLIEEGFLKTKDDVINYLRDRWKDAWIPKVFNKPSKP